MNLKLLAKIQIYQPIALPAFNNAIISRKDDMADLSDALLFKAEKKLMMEEKGNGSSMSRSALGELANTTFNSHQEHCPRLVFDVDHTNMQSDYIPLPTAGSAHQALCQGCY